MALRKVIQKSILYIAPKKRSITVDTDGTKESASIVFAETRKDMLQLMKERSIKFEFLHGIDLYHKLSHFCDQMDNLLIHLPKQVQLSNLIKRELEKFRAALTEVEQRTKESELAFAQFELMYATLYSKKLEPSIIEQQLEEQFDSWWQLAKKFGTKVEREDLKSIQPKTVQQFIKYLQKQQDCGIVIVMDCFSTPISGRILEQMLISRECSAKR